MIPYAGKDSARSDWNQKGLHAVDEKAIRKYFTTHLCASGRECARALHLDEKSVSRIVKKIRMEWFYDK